MLIITLILCKMSRIVCCHWKVLENGLKIKMVFYLDLALMLDLNSTWKKINVASLANRNVEYNLDKSRFLCFYTIQLLF